MAFEKIKVLGAGSTLLDILARVDAAFLTEHVAGEKGGMNLVNSETQHGLIDKLDQAGMSKAIGGSAFNTVSALTTLGFKTAFIGKLGKDEDGMSPLSNIRRRRRRGLAFVLLRRIPSGPCGRISVRRRRSMPMTFPMPILKALHMSIWKDTSCFSSKS